MESEQVLQHYGILGQKWGIRRYQNPDGTLTPAGKKKYRYQNPDGSLTEEGKKDYMTAARKGKLDPKKLSDADLNMINTRFAKEKTYAQNVEGYQKSTFKYRLQEAVIDRIKGGGGDGGGKKGGKKGGGGGKGLGSILATPIKKAFEDAFKESKDNGKDDDYDDTMDQWWKDVSKKGHRSVDKYFDPTKQHDIERTKEDIERGKKHMEFAFNSISGGRAGTYDSTADGNSYMEKKLRERQEAKKAEQARRAAERDKENRRQKKEASKRRKERELEERLSKSGLILGHSAFVIHRIGDDELMHHGIKGQKWGVRRFQNPDGTRTEEGKKRYLPRGEYRKILRSGKNDEKALRKEWNEERAKARNDDEKNRVDAEYMQLMSGMMKSRSTLEKNAGHQRKSDGFSKKGDELSRKAEGLRKSDKLLNLYASEYDEMVKSGKYDDEQELKEIYMMERQDLQNKRTKDLVGTSTYLEGDFVRSCGELANSSMVRRRVDGILNTSSDPQIKKAKEAAENYRKASNEYNSAYPGFSKRLEQDRGKGWDGDGSEQHEELLKRYPEYAKIFHKEQRALKNLVDNSKALAKNKEFSKISAFEQSKNFYEPYPEEYGDWYKKGDQRAYVIAKTLMDGRNTKSAFDIFPEHFIESYDKDGKMLNGWFFDTSD